MWAGLWAGSLTSQAAREISFSPGGLSERAHPSDESQLFYIVQALVHVKVGLGIAPVQIESLERGPWSELRGQVPANIVSGKTEDRAQCL
jgi:hypothetical protein